jgi:hypothetical protein
MFFLASRAQYQAPKVWSKAPKCRTRVAKSIFADLFMKVSSLAQVLRVLLVVSPLIRCTMKNYAVDRGRGVLEYTQGTEGGDTVQIRVANSIFADLFITVSSLAQALRGHSRGTINEGL